MQCTALIHLIVIKVGHLAYSQPLLYFSEIFCVDLNMCFRLLGFQIIRTAMAVLFLLISAKRIFDICEAQAFDTCSGFGCAQDRYCLFTYGVHYRHLHTSPEISGGDFMRGCHSKWVGGFLYSSLSMPIIIYYTTYIQEYISIQVELSVPLNIFTLI